MTTPSWRKPFGAFLIMAIIALWAALVLLASPLIEKLPMLLQAVVYTIAGIVWILPLKPLLAWMEAGVESDRPR
jgi:predicted membrane channel-forming protein YqfA (hemolysin III family)